MLLNSRCLVSLVASFILVAILAVTGSAKDGVRAAPRYELDGLHQAVLVCIGR